MPLQYSESEQKDIFQKLVTLQEQGTPVPQSRQQIADQFNLSLDQAIEIERNGVSANWPPLS